MSKFARSVILASSAGATAQANQPVRPDSALPSAQPVPTLNSAPMVVPAAPEISAKAHILIDYFGQVLAEQNADERLPPPA
jgi:D-alanyl-D-alanine carboxypeptidase (penicillin-binding protein 5/6)